MGQNFWGGFVFIAIQLCYNDTRNMLKLRLTYFYTNLVTILITLEAIIVINSEKAMLTFAL